MNDLAGGGSRRAALAALFTGVLAVSFAAIFLRAAQAPALSLAFWRLLIAACVLLPIVIARRERWPRGRELAATAAAGLFLALHFGTWIASLERTSVAASVVLVCTQPVFVAILARVLLGERTTTRVLVGTAIAIAGVGLVAMDARGGADDLAGDALALCGAVAIAAYVLCGRAVKATTGLFAYSALVSLFGAAFLLPAAIVFDAPLTGYSDATWLFIVLVALIPHVVGHTLLNQALRRLPAMTVSGSILLEPVVCTALAAIFLHETPGPWTIAGGIVTLMGLRQLLAEGTKAAPSSSARTRRCLRGS